MTLDEEPPIAPNKAKLLKLFELLDSASASDATNAYLEAHQILREAQQKFGDYMDIQQIGLPELTDQEDALATRVTFWSVREELIKKRKTFSEFFIGELKDVRTAPRDGALAVAEAPSSRRAVSTYQTPLTTEPKEQGWKKQFARAAIAVCAISAAVCFNHHMQVRDIEATTQHLNTFTWNEKQGDQPIAVRIKKSYLFIDTTQWVYLKDWKGPEVFVSEKVIAPTYCRETGSIKATKIGDNYKVFPRAMDDAHSNPRGFFGSIFGWFFNPTIESSNCSTTRPGFVVTAPQKVFGRH